MTIAAARSARFTGRSAVTVTSPADQGGLYDSYPDEAADRGAHGLQVVTAARTDAPLAAS